LPADRRAGTDPLVTRDRKSATQNLDIVDGRTPVILNRIAADPRATPQRECPAVDLDAREGGRGPARKRRADGSASARIDVVGAVEKVDEIADSD
jgi:hypothetical protein